MAVYNILDSNESEEVYRHGRRCLRPVIWAKTQIHSLREKSNPLFCNLPLERYISRNAGAQVVGYFHSGNMHNPKETLYRFKNPEGKRFRLKNLSHATYTWNIYQMNPASSTE